MKQGPSIATAELDWDAAGVPRSRRHGDVYFSVDNGLEETRHVFLSGNDLEKRFSRHQPGRHFVIAETGFGTGLNFLAAAQLFLEQAPGDHYLHFISFEKYPLHRQDLVRALALWPELATISDELLSHYPPPVSGLHRLVLAQARVRLTLYFGDALTGLDELDFKADAWFLDGFAPARNPELWQQSLLQRLGTHSRSGTTLATFTAAGAVRRTLASQGFRMTKQPGYGRKRDMLTGLYDAGDAGPTVQAAESGHRSVLVLGAGMAGAMVAANLAERGIAAVVVDQGPIPGTGASGNAQGALYVKLGVDFNDQVQLALSGLLFSQRRISQWQDAAEHLFWQKTGLLQLASTPAESDRQRRFLKRNNYPSEIFSEVDADTASELAGQPLSVAGLWFPASGWVSPPRLCQQLLDRPGISCHFGVTVVDIEQTQGQWHLKAQDGRRFSATELILCSGSALPDHLQALAIPARLRTIRGQISGLPTRQKLRPKVVLCADGYLGPPLDDRLWLGATFDLHDTSPEVTRTGHRENLDRVRRWFPTVDALLAPDALTQAQGRVGFRCTSNDYQPLAGPCGPPNLYALGGLASKGLALAPLLAEYVTDLVCGEPPALPRHIGLRVSPLRWLT